MHNPSFSKVPRGQVTTQVEPRARRVPEQDKQLDELLHAKHESSKVRHAIRIELGQLIIPLLQVQIPPWL